MEARAKLFGQATFRRGVPLTAVGGSVACRIPARSWRLWAWSLDSCVAEPVNDVDDLSKSPGCGAWKRLLGSCWPGIRTAIPSVRNRGNTGTWTLKVVLNPPRRGKGEKRANLLVLGRLGWPIYSEHRNVTVRPSGVRPGNPPRMRAHRWLGGDLMKHPKLSILI